MGALAIIEMLLELLPPAIKVTTQIVDVVDRVSYLRSAGIEPTDADFADWHETMTELTAGLNKDP
jgi:hypothetical protein